MYKYEVGQIIPAFMGHAENVYFNMDNGGATMFVFFQSPTMKEIKQFKSGKEFQIRFVELYDVIMLMAKIGDLDWMDAPYTPHLSPDLTQFAIPTEGQGLGLTLILVDATTGQIKSIRLLGLSENFTRKLLGTVIKNAKKTFNINSYNMNIVKIYSQYPTKKLVKMSNDYCKIN